MTFADELEKIQAAYPYLTADNLDEVNRDVDGELENIHCAPSCIMQRLTQWWYIQTLTAMALWRELF